METFWNLQAVTMICRLLFVNDSVCRAPRSAACRLCGLRYSGVCPEQGISAAVIGCKAIVISQSERCQPIVPLIDASGPPVSCHIRGGAVHSFIVVSQTIRSLKSHGTLQARSEATYLATERTSQPPDLPALRSGHSNRSCPSIGGPEDIISVCCHTVCPGRFWWKHEEKTKKTTPWKSLPGVPSLSLNLKPKVSDWLLGDFSFIIYLLYILWARV